MNTISYCTTCKGRLWQLIQTLPKNIRKTNEFVDLVILDYHSEDGLEEYIKSNYQSHLENGTLKYYKLITPIDGFDMAYAKHIAHMLATGRMLFNLDADNLIGDTIDEMNALPTNKILIPTIINGTATARCGRVGMRRVDYLRIGGYDIKMLGMQNDDGDIVHRAWLAGLRYSFSKDKTIPIKQSIDEKYKYIKSELKYELPTKIEVQDWNGFIKTIDLLHNVNRIKRIEQ